MSDLDLIAVCLYLCLKCSTFNRAFFFFFFLFFFICLFVVVFFRSGTLNTV